MTRRLGIGCYTLTATLTALFVSLHALPRAQAQSVAQVLTAKRIAPSTVALIDPESGSSSGGSSTDVNYAVGDVLTFVLRFTAVHNNNVRGYGGYLTEYVPPNTQVVGVRITDRNGNTIWPNRGGAAPDGYGKNQAYKYDTNFGLELGSLSQLYADTGIFYSTDSRTARNPSNALPTVTNGYQMVPAPNYANTFDQLLGIPGGPYYIHNLWDWVQVMAFGTPGEIGSPVGGDINKFGSGATPHLYGSPVAGPQTHFTLEATQTGASTIVPNGVTGPWQRIAYPGSETGTGSFATAVGTNARVGVQTGAGWVLSSANPLPASTKAVRYALGALRVGEEYLAEISLKVLASPLDPGVNLDANCGEVFGGAGDRDNPWGFALPSSNCVLLNLLFELDVDKILAVQGDTVVYTVKGKNLSTNTRTNVVVTDTFNDSDLSIISVTGGGVVGSGVITWPTIPTWDPSDEFEYTVTAQINGQGQGSTFNTAKIVYDQLPAGFTTQALVNRIALALVDFDMTALPNQVSPGNSFKYQVTINNSGNAVADGDCSGCGYAVTLPSGFSVVSGTSKVNGANVANPSSSGARYFWGSGTVDIPVGGSVTLEFDVAVGGGVANGVYTSCAEMEGKVPSVSGSDFNDSKCGLGAVAVGAARSTAPVLDAPIFEKVTCVAGSTSEPDGTLIKIYLNGIYVTSDTASAGRFNVCGLPPLYGGQLVTATATAPGELESVQSAQVSVLVIPRCSDGIDNDGDGKIDFPADPGCDSPLDSTEADPPTPQCSDGIDNDGDSLIDLFDPGCASPSDDQEGGLPECSDGEDNDGDTKVDYPSDPGCTSSNDATETEYPACMDGIDNDGDGKIDFGSGAGNDPGCHSGNDDDEVDPIVTSSQIKPRLLVLFDTSGSMNWHTCASEFTGGDGSAECAGSDVVCGTGPGQCNTAGCGNSLPDDSRLAKVKKGITNVVSAFGTVEFGLMRFHQRPMPFACPTSNASAQSGGWQGSTLPPCAGGFSAGDLLVDFADANQTDLLQWIDGKSNYEGTPPPGLDIELRGTGTTPLAGSLGSALSHISTVRTADVPSGPCRPYKVILVTDGQETCDLTLDAASTAAGQLKAANIPVHVVGFATTDTAINTALNDIAAAGGTTSAVLVDNEVALSLAMATIISESLLSEKCNGIDDDCDTLCDEDYPEVAVTNPLCSNQRSAQQCSAGLGICKRTGDFVCDGDNAVKCGVTAGEPNPGGEICDNGLDDDCDGAIDEGCTPCVPQAEICDGKDNDCDGSIDEGFVSQPCGSSIGECLQGNTACVGGQVVCQGGSGPTAEICDGLDNNCDTIVDTFNVTCYPHATGCNTSTGVCAGTCQIGTRFCSNNAWVPSATGCTGDVGPQTEVCNGLDDNCDGNTDEGVLNNCINYNDCSTFDTCSACPAAPAEICDGLDNDCDGTPDDNALGVGDPCGTAVGECTRGTFVCDGVNGLKCQGGVQPTAETCDGKDNDCDGVIDEGLLGGACGSAVGECKQGVEQCIGGQAICVGQIGPVGEVCDGKDNDCDGSVDDNIASGNCGTDVGECAAGTTACVAGQTVCQNAVGPQAEVCDGKDNDCDGVVDDNPTDVGGFCGTDTGECQMGVFACASGVKVCVGAIGQQTEICDGKDNDCDGQVDEDVAGTGAPCGSDVGLCQQGSLQCQNIQDVGWTIICVGGAAPAQEICDGEDNDCDGAVDEDYPEKGQTCSSGIGECKAGLYKCTNGQLNCDGGTEGEPETCDGLDNDCNGAIDDNVPGDSQPCGAATGECEQGVNKCVGGQFICVGEVGAGTEICDGKDNDCDGEIDESAECPGASLCVEGQCLVPCGTGEFACPGGTSCINGYCVPDACANVKCPGTARCVEGSCVERCDGINCLSHEKCDPNSGLCIDDSCVTKGCPTDEICVGFECKPDPCGPGTCAEGQQCSDGKCYDTCLNVTCTGGQSCVQGKCVDDPCETYECDSNNICQVIDGKPKCVADPCRVISCPTGEVCLDAECKTDPCATTDCPEGTECKLTTSGKPNCTKKGQDITITRKVLATGAGGCACRLDGDGEPPPLTPLIPLALWLVVRRRRSPRSARRAR